MQVHNPYQDAFSFRWFKGDLHVHSSASDGRADAAAVRQRLVDCGFDFMALADHDIYHETQRDAVPVMLGNNEMRSLNGDVLSLFSRLPRMNDCQPQQVIEAINEAGGLAVLAHPKIGEFTDNKDGWTFESKRLIKELRGYAGIEIYTHNVKSGFQEAVDRLHAVWTYWLSRGEHRPNIWGYASSDAHDLEAITPDVGILVAADECTPEALRGALEAGRFYSLGSSRARFTGISVEDGVLIAAARGARLMEAYGMVQDKPSGNKCRLAIRWSGADETVEMRYTLTGGEGFIRLQATDANGCNIYANPIAVVEA